MSAEGVFRVASAFEGFKNSVVGDEQGRRRKKSLRQRRRTEIRGARDDHVPNLDHVTLQALAKVNFGLDEIVLSKHRCSSTHKTSDI